MISLKIVQESTGVCKVTFKSLKRIGTRDFVGYEKRDILELFIAIGIHMCVFVCVFLYIYGYECVYVCIHTYTHILH